jgi:hypothetical protein
VNGHSEFELLDAYALGTLDPREMEYVREHLETCASCRREYDEVRSVLDVLPHGLAEERPSKASRERLLARLDAPARAPAAPGVLAAGLVLALAGDAWLGWQFHERRSASVAVVQTTPAPTFEPTPVPTRKPTPMPSVEPSHTAPPARSATRAPVAPSAAPVAVPVRPSEEALRVRVAQLKRALLDERRSADARDARDADRIAELQSALARKAAQLTVAQRATSRPVAQPAAPQTPSPELLAALSNGRVYGVDGTVGSEPWHLTIVQPPAGANALIFSQVPHAPTGDTYRTWVLRSGKTFDAGELPAGTQTKLEMPMPLEDGDVVAFSREPVGGGDRPTNPFLMEVTIK